MWWQQFAKAQLGIQLLCTYFVVFGFLLLTMMLILYVNILRGWTTADHLSRNNNFFHRIQIPHCCQPHSQFHCCKSPISKVQTGHQHTSVSYYFYHQHSLAISIHKFYGTGIQRYLSFCQSINHTPTPTSELTLLLFVAYLAQSQLSLSTIKVYLLVVHSLHLTSGFLGVFNTQSTPHLG